MSSKSILTVLQMRAAEQKLLDSGISAHELMQTAGTGAGEWVWRMAGGRSTTILCGSGNNGGDGYVIAEYLRQKGMDVCVVAPEPPNTTASRAAATSYKGKTVDGSVIPSAQVLVDCLFGSGLNRPLKSSHASLLMDLSKNHPTRVAIDVPSGVDSNTGELLTDYLPNYRLTLALGAWKFAHWKAPAREKMGVLKLVPIGIAEFPKQSAFLISKPKISAPKFDQHKYSRGMCLVVGGVMPGASALAAEAALRAGAGYVKLASRLKVKPRLVSKSVVVSHINPDETPTDKRIKAVLIGPGLGKDKSASQHLESVLASKIPTVLDADALTLLTPKIPVIDTPLLAMPHDGELVGLLETFNIKVSSRDQAVLRLANESGMVICAKGPNTLIASPDGKLGVAPPATSWLSTAGTGDVLAGIALSRLATGLTPFEAACQATWVHALAARRCGVGFTADELALAVSDAIADLI